MLFVLLACSSEDADTASVEEAKDSEFSAFQVAFFGDAEMWTHIVAQCKDNFEEMAYVISGLNWTTDDRAFASFSVPPTRGECDVVFFNVKGPGGLNTDPHVLGIPGEALFLWAYDAWGVTLYPSTYSGVPFLEGGGMLPFDPERGWPYLPSPDEPQAE